MIRWALHHLIAVWLSGTMVAVMVVYLFGCLR